MSEISESRKRYEVNRDRFLRDIPESFDKRMILQAMDGAYALGEVAGSTSETSMALQAQAAFLEDQDSERKLLREHREATLALQTRQTVAIEKIMQFLVGEG